MILKEETIKKFGYNPFVLGEKSNRLIVARCSICLCERTIRKDSYRPVCKKCSSIKSGSTRRGKKNPRLYFTEKDIKDFRKRQNDKSNIKRRSTLEGRLIDRLGASFRHAIKPYRTEYEITGVFKNFSYNKKEFLEYMGKCFADCNYICPICKSFDLRNDFDLDHKIPLSKANTLEETLKLFELENFGLLCPTCNRYVKRHRELEY